MYALVKTCFFSSFLFILFSCESTKTLYYFNDQTPGSVSLDSIKGFSSRTHVIQSNDRLSITVSSTDPNLTSYLNPYGYTQNTSNGASGSGYLVSEQGTIEFPLLGKVQLKGLTTNEASTLIKEKLSYYYKNLFVAVSLSGRVFIINGKNGVAVPVSNERLTIFEGRTQAGIQDPGDLRNDVWLIREDSGKRFYEKIDLTSKSVFESRYYYLKNNDFVYIKPAKIASLLAGNSSIKLALASIVTIITLVITLRKL